MALVVNETHDCMRIWGHVRKPLDQLGKKAAFFGAPRRRDRIRVEAWQTGVQAVVSLLIVLPCVSRILPRLMLRYRLTAGFGINEQFSGRPIWIRTRYTANYRRAAYFVSLSKGQPGDLWKNDQVEHW